MSDMLSLSAIGKRFGRVQALTDVSLDFPPGEIHAILGENGAGKSTLMHVLAGLYSPDAGSIQLDGHAVRFGSPLAARRAGIGMVHQHFTLVEPLTVAENIVLALPERPRFWLSARAAARHARQLADRLGLALGDPLAITGTLPVGLRQRIEIAKALAAEARILILDEPTAVLTREETSQLFVLLRRLREAGRLILFITHKLREVREVADRVTVMRRGAVIATHPVAALSEREMAELMIGAPAPGRSVRCAIDANATERLRGDDLHTAADAGQPLRGVSFALRAGEVLGVAGVAGNGQQELFEVLVGVRQVSAGELRVNGRVAVLRSPADAAGVGIGHIPPDRHRDGVAMTMSVADNAVLNARVLQRLRVGIRLPRRGVAAFAAAIVHRHAVKTDGIDVPVASLSGGNQQRLIVGRQLAPEPDVLVAVDPTRGLDIAAAQAVYDALDRFVGSGRSVLLISTDLDEVLDLSHRVVVLYEGRLSAPRTPPIAPDVMGRLMAGASA
jgi:simple sugar transport system ATP-binding protein